MLMAQREAEFFRKQDIFPASGGAFYISNPHLKDYPIVYANATFCAQTGYNLDDCIGRNCRFLLVRTPFHHHRFLASYPDPCACCSARDQIARLCTPCVTQSPHLPNGYRWTGSPARGQTNPLHLVWTSASSMRRRMAPGSSTLSTWPHCTISRATSSGSWAANTALA